jgi:hypothetical protein
VSDKISVNATKLWLVHIIWTAVNNDFHEHCVSKGLVKQIVSRAVGDACALENCRLVVVVVQ